MKMPKKVWLYVCDYDSGKPILAIAEKINEITEDSNGEKIGEYRLVTESEFVVNKELKPLKQKT